MTETEFQNSIVKQQVKPWLGTINTAALVPYYPVIYYKVSGLDVNFLDSEAHLSTRERCELSIRKFCTFLYPLRQWLQCQSCLWYFLVFWHNASLHKADICPDSSCIVVSGPLGVSHDLRHGSFFVDFSCVGLSGHIFATNRDELHAIADFSHVLFHDDFHDIALRALISFGGLL